MMTAGCQPPRDFEKISGCSSRSDRSDKLLLASERNDDGSALTLVALISDVAAKETALCADIRPVALLRNRK